MQAWEIACLGQEDLRIYTMFMDWEKRRGKAHRVNAHSGAK